jgi:hypothetical protein
LFSTEIRLHEEKKIFFLLKKELIRKEGIKKENILTSF